MNGLATGVRIDTDAAAEVMREKQLLSRRGEIIKELDSLVNSNFNTAITHITQFVFPFCDPLQSLVLTTSYASYYPL